MEDFKTQIKNIIDGLSNCRKTDLMDIYGVYIWEDLNIKATCVDEYGGEDQGSTYYAVWELESENGEKLYVKFDGYYASHYGADYNDWCFVTPRQKTVTEYV